VCEHYPDRDLTSFDLPAHLEHYRAVEIARREAYRVNYVPYENIDLRTREIIQQLYSIWHPAETAYRQLQNDARQRVNATCCDLFRDVVSYPYSKEHENWQTDWNTTDVVSLANVMHESWDFSLMPILADMLEDVGCVNPYVTSHCRAEKPHARGCWALKLIIGEKPLSYEPIGWAH
jgi:hypothetical protein